MGGGWQLIVACCLLCGEMSLDLLEKLTIACSGGDRNLCRGVESSIRFNSWLDLWYCRVVAGCCMGAVEYFGVMSMCK